MKIYSAQHRAIVEAPIMEEPNIESAKYSYRTYSWECDAFDAPKFEADTKAYQHWLTTHIPVLPEHQHLFKDGQEVENDIDYGVEGRWIIKPEDRYPNGDHKGIKTFVTVAIPIKQQQLPVEETYHKELTNPIMRAKYVKAGQRLVDWLKQHYHVPIKQQVSEEGGGYYFKLFKFFSDQHDLTLLDSEIQDIIHAVNDFQSEEDKEPLPQQDAWKEKFYDWKEEYRRKRHKDPMAELVRDWIDLNVIAPLQSQLSEALQTIKELRKEIAEDNGCVFGLREHIDSLEDQVSQDLAKIKSQEAEIADLRKQLK
jgi:hypothetical protein